MKKISAALKNYIVDAIALIVLGLVMVIWSDSALETIFRWVGIGLIVLGAIKGVSFFVKKKDRSVIDLLVGIVQIAVGIFFAVKPDILAAHFPTVAAILLAYGAIVILIRAIRLKDGNRNTFILSLVLGIVCLVLAVIVFVHPSFLTDVMVPAAGVSMIVGGISLLIVLSRTE